MRFNFLKNTRITSYNVCYTKLLRFGYVILNGDFEMSEWGFFSMNELRSINVQGVFQVEYDVLWKPRPAKDVELIRRGRGVCFDPRDGGHWKWHTLQN